MHTDRIVRFDPKTDRTLEYPLPNTTNIRSVWMDDQRRRPRSGLAAITAPRWSRSSRSTRA